MRVKFPLLCVLLTLLAPAAHAQTLHIGAAANLQKVLTEAIVPAFQKKTGATVVPTFASTKLLAAQLQNGAPEDVFISADTDTVTKLAAQGLLDITTVRPYAVGHLVVWTRQDAPLHPKKLSDLTDPRYAKIAIANPALAPYGKAAQQAFAAAGLTASVTPRLVQGENIGAALQYAQSGNADVCLTALSLVVQDKTDPYFVVPQKLHAPLVQSAGVVKGGSQNALAHTFVDFITSKDCARLWKCYGYSVPGK